MKSPRLAFPFSPRLAFLMPLFAAIGTTPAADDPAIRARDGFGNLHFRCSVEKKAHIAFLGGSITQNGKGHVAMVPDWLRQKYPDAEVTVTNAGLSSTCSVSGAFRVAEDVLSQGPVDLLVVEFAVNDDQDAGHSRATAIRGMEGIIAQVRAANPATDILMVHFVNPEMLAKVQAGETPVSIDAHEAVAEKWSVTTVNVTTALAEAIRTGRQTWESYGGVHPKADGYRFASDLMIRAIGDGFKSVESVAQIATRSVAHPAPETPLDAHSYTKPKAIDLQEASWLGGWKWGVVGKDLVPLGSIRADYLDRPLLRADEPGSMLYLDFMGRALTAFVLAGPDSGFLEVSVNGGEWKPIALFHQHSKGLNYPRTVILADDLPAGFHQVALRTGETKPEGSEGVSASVLKLSVNE